MCGVEVTDIMNTQPDFAACLILFVWVLGFVKLWNDTKPRPRYLDLNAIEKVMT